MTIDAMAQTQCGWTSVMGAFGTGVALGIWGGLLLGSLEAHVLVCLESLIHMPNNLSRPNNTVVVFIGTYCDTVVVLSSTVGILFGVASYSGVLKVKGEGAAGKALASAGPVCLIFVTLTGGALGTMLFRDTLFLCHVFGFYVTLSLGIVLFVVWSFFTFFQPSVIDKVDNNISRLILANICIVYILTTLCFQFMIRELPYVRALAIVLLIMLLCGFLIKQHNEQNNVSVGFLGLSVSTMSFLTETLLVVMRPVVTFETAESKMNEVTPFVFYTLLTSQLIMASIGMSLFVSWQRGGAGKTSAVAVSSGGAVLGAVKFLLPLGPGPSIGAVMGVAGAVGVSLAAAGAAAERYGRGGRLGVTVGAAAGAFVASCAHSGLSGVFMALCAATIPLVHYCTLIIIQIHNTDQTSCEMLSAFVFGAVFLLWLVVEAHLYI